ncbi:MAG: HTTM domain-containing protein, partial [Mameliella sp.]|nr:HTTM domain-containing protein [Phaeodactylibacter sp.]
STYSSFDNQPGSRLKRGWSWLNELVSIAPLVSFRLVFGAVMLYSTLRFWSLGWIADHFIDTQITFKYFGFEWVQLLPPEWMYLLHGLMILSALGITIGLFYRISATLFFLSFTYIELIDLTYYLNHYYFVSLISFLLIWVPANGRFAVDTLLFPKVRRQSVPRWSIGIFKLQIAIVYIYAGLAKINADWLLHGLPLRIWVPSNDKLPLIGFLFNWKITPYLFSWIGMLYDATIVFWLSWKRTRLPAYIAVVLFHWLTGLMFQIGVFPIVMIGATWIYFSPSFHERFIGFLEKLFSRIGVAKVTISEVNAVLPKAGVALSTLLILFFSFQLLFPWRYLLYPGNVFWTEEGYRFSWRVMLMEKAGTATFYVTDRETGRRGVVDNAEFLKPHQEKQMAMQPDMILQYAHFLADHYAKIGVHDPIVEVEAYVTLNARPSRLLIDPKIDLTTIEDNWKPKEWILPYEKTQ